MHLLQVNRRVAALFGMCELGDGSSIFCKITQKMRIVLYLVILISADWFSASSAREQLRLDGFEKSVFNLVQVAVIFAVTASLVSLINSAVSTTKFRQFSINVIDFQS